MEKIRQIGLVFLVIVYGPKKCYANIQVCVITSLWQSNEWN